MHTDSELTDFIGLGVYTQKGHYIGVVQNVLVDLPKRSIGSLLLTRTSTQFVEDGMDVAVPYRWVSAIGDILILSHFPELVVAAAEGEAGERAKEAEETVYA
jgi:sporulation protein YlmC with PRC-barrel domain